MQAPSADETIQRLIFGLSELDELGETIISGHGNFSVSSRTYLRMILGTMQVTGGAILLFHPTENTLTIKSSVNVRDESLVIRVPPDQISGFLGHPFIDLSNPPAVLQPFLEQIQSHLDSLDARFWLPLKIRDEFLGVISVGAFFDADEIEDWNRELLNVFANHTSIAIAYSQPASQEPCRTVSALHALPIPQPKSANHWIRRRCRRRWWRMWSRCWTQTPRG